MAQAPSSSSCCILTARLPYARVCSYASIHPCKHPQVMHKLTSELLAAGRECKPEQYLFLFLKFISSVCPTIEYDYTLSVDGL